VDPTITAMAFAAFTGALGFLLSRELGRADGVGKKTQQSGETLSALAASVTRLEHDQVACNANHAALRESVREQFQTHQAAFEARLAAQRDSTHKIQESWNTAMTSLSSAVARLEATVTSLSSQIESLTDAERARTTLRSPEASLTERLREFAEFQRLLVAKP
jgi:exonuclease VII small subunit